MNSSLTDVSARDLRKAATLKERIEELQSELSRLLGGSSSGSGMRATTAPSSTSNSGPRRRMSASARARLAAVARARWKKAKASGKNAL